MLSVRKRGLVYPEGTTVEDGDGSHKVQEEEALSLLGAAAPFDEIQPSFVTPKTKSLTREERKAQTLEAS